MFCRYCGAKLGDSDAYCHNCGKPTSEQKPVEETQYIQPDNNQSSGFADNNTQNTSGNTGNQQSAQNGNGNSVNKQSTDSCRQSKSKLAAGLLAILVGCFGVHNFYLGYTGRAVVQLLLTVLTFGICAFPVAIWSLIEGILYLTGKSGYTTDAWGVPLTD